MITLGWILWGLICILALFLFRIVIKEMLNKTPGTFQRSLRALLLELLTLAGVIFSLYFTVAREVSKFHLLWIVPVSCGAALLLGGLIIIVFEPLRSRKHFKKGFKEVNDDIKSTNK